MDTSVFIVRLDEYEPSGCKQLHEVQNQIQQQLEFQHQQKWYKELVDKLVMKADPTELSNFTEFCLRQAYDRWGQSRISVVSQQ